MKFKPFDDLLKLIGYERSKPKLFIEKSIANAQELARNRWGIYEHDFQNPYEILIILQDMIMYSDEKPEITYDTIKLMAKLITSVKWFHYNMKNHEVILVPRKWMNL
jgi:hypothetical protein